MKALFDTIRGHTFCADLIGASSTVLDIGANRGAFSSAMVDRYHLTSIPVEANPELARRLRETGWPLTVHAALVSREVASKQAHVAFNIALNDEGSSVLTLPETSAYRCTHVQTVMVPTTHIEQLLDDHRIPTLDLLKMDIEGAEIEVLEHLETGVLDRIKQITLEFHAKSIFGFGLERQTRDVIRRLQDLGFMRIDFSREQLTDVLFINTKRCGIGRLRAAILTLQGDQRSWGRRLWNPMPTPMKNAIRGLAARMKIREIIIPRHKSRTP